MSLGFSLLQMRTLPTWNALFPLTEGLSSWTTFQGSPNALPLSNDILRPRKNIAELGPWYELFPDTSKNTIRIHYPEGSYKLSATPRGGVSFYSSGPEQCHITGDAELTNAKEATFGYSVYFPEDFDFVKGGKLPGFYGGNTEEGSVSCSGGRKDTVCFSTRLMWRANGAGEVYAYFPAFDVPGFEANAALCSAPSNFCDPTYGISLGRGNFTFKTGDWTTVTQRVRLNDPGVANGVVELWADGESVLRSEGIILVDDSGLGRIRGLFVQSFFGGSTVDWATPKPQDIWISDFSVAVIEELEPPPPPPESPEP